MNARVHVIASGVLVALAALGPGRVLAQSPSGTDSQVEPSFGSFTTSVSMEVPSYHALEPSLRLVYSSSATNGFAGTGWTLTGFSSIERASPGRGTPAYITGDVFVLDGQELVPCAAGSSSPSCTTGGTHSTRIENFHRISYDGATNTWSVWRKDGTRLTYSPTFQTGWGTFRWGLSSAADTRGHQVSYAWWCDGHDCYPDSVSYNGTTVKLYREARPDHSTFPTGHGSLGRTQYRLKTVDIVTSGARVRAYKLSYGRSASTGRSLLTGVQQFGRDAVVDTAGTVTSGTALPARAYGYDSAMGTTWSRTWSYGHGVGDAGWSYVDIDGDGKTEYVTHSTNGYHYATFYNRDGTLTSRTWSNGHGVGDAGWSFADIDGDGKAEYVTHSTNGYHYATFYNRDGTLTNRTWSYGHGVGDAGWTYADIDGDGKAEYVTHSTNGYFYATFFNKDGTLTNRTWTGGHGVGDAGWSFADIDGDGKAEYVTHSTNGYHYATFFNKDGTLTSRTWAGGHGVGNAGWTYADINGDGRADYITHSTDGTHYATFFNGIWVENRTWTGGHGVGDAGWSYVDINGDGKVEYVTHSRNGAHYATFFSDTGVTNWTQWGHGVGDAGSTYADIDGDGKAEYVTHSTNGHHYATWLNGGGDLLVSASNGMGGATSVQYRPSSVWSNTYLPLGVVFPTASAVTVSDGRGASSTTSYQYQGALWSSAERRFLGFRKVTAVLDAAGNYTETYYHQHNGCISKPEVTYYRDPAGRIYSYSSFSYSENAAPPYTSLMTQRWEYECNLSTSCRRTLLQIGYDQYGNGYLTHEHGDYDVAGDERTSLRGLYPNTSAYVVGLPAYENTYAGIGTGGALLRQTLHEYDGNGTYAAAPTVGLVTRQLAWNNQTGGYAVRAFGYDAFGNRTSETDARGSTTTFTYDSTYRVHVVKQCNALDQCSSRTWDHVLGVITSETDINGGVTTYTHDALGRPVQSQLPNGSTETFSYLAWGDPNLQRIRKVVSDGTPDGLWTEAYEDGLGRRYKVVKEGGLVQETLYQDGSRRIWKQSTWYGPGESPQYQTFTFDGLGRPRTVTNPDGTYGQRVYGNGYVAIYDESGHEKVIWLDAYGQTSQIREKNGSAYYYTSYKHDLLGHLVRVTDTAGNVSTATWDSLGRKLSGCDPDTGCSDYTYEAGGLMLSLRDARGNLITFTYDALGRMRTKTYPGGQQVTWTYDEAGHGAGLGALTTVTDPSGGESRSYDFAGRVTSSTKCVSGTCYTLHQSYDLAGRLASVTYPDGEVVPYTYDGAGRLQSVGGYVTGFTYTGGGQLRTATFANGTKASYNYASTRQWLTEASVTGPAGVLYQASYGYDAASRVTSTSSSTHPLSNLSYTYDDLGRLTAVSGAQSQTFGYDALGNMTWNSAVGSYSYADIAHRHAVTVAGGTSYIYDPSGNLVQGGGRALEWDAESRLTRVTTASGTTTFTYDSSGQRVMKSGPAGTVRYFGQLLELGPNGLTKYYYAGPLLVARRDGTGASWYHQDHLGSIRAITNQSGAQVASYDYAPFGAPLASNASLSNSHGYGGHVTDETGLVYMKARYYDPQLGRFISADPLVPSADNPQALNRYAYVYNNPISNTDPTGHAPVVAAVAIAASVGATVGWTSTAFVIAAIGAATTTAGYVMKDPVLMSIGGVLLGAASGYAFGAGFLGNAMTSQAAWVGGSVSALTSPVSPLDPKVKNAIGWAYTAQSLFHELGKLNETLEKGSERISKSVDTSNPNFAAEKTKLAQAPTDEQIRLLNEPERWTSVQRQYGQAVEKATNGALTAGEAIALNPTGGLVGPSGGLGTRVLDGLVGWIPGVRAHSILHDMSGFLVNRLGTGNGYLYLGLNWFGMSAGNMVAGQVEGLLITGGSSLSSLFRSPAFDD